MVEKRGKLILLFVKKKLRVKVPHTGISYLCVNSLFKELRSRQTLFIFLLYYMKMFSLVFWWLVSVISLYFEILATFVVLQLFWVFFTTPFYPGLCGGSITNTKCKSSQYNLCHVRVQKTDLQGKTGTCKFNL